MKLKMFAVRDTKLGVYRPPFCVQHAGQALRGWEEQVNKPESELHKYASDFSLYEVGTFDDDSGDIEQLNQHRLVGTAFEYLKKPASVPNN